MAYLPLEGTRILAFTQLGAGPYAMTILADLGAEVVKVEDPRLGGDEARRVPPQAEGGDSVYFQALNRGARSLTLDLRHPLGRELLHRLVRVSDAVYANLRGDLPSRLGLDYAALAPHNPRIVCCCLSGFGKTGPRCTQPGYDFLVQALTGFMSLTGDPDQSPQRCGVSVVDFAGGLMSAVGLLAGILRARATGTGGDVDVSLFDTAISMLNYMAAWWWNLGHAPQRLADGAHQSLVPSQTFATRDGFVVIMCMKEKFWQRLCDRIGHPEWKQDPRFHTFADRFRNRDVLVPLLREVFAQRTTAEWIQLLEGEVPCAPVRSVPEALEDPQVAARELRISVRHPRYGELWEVGCPIHFAGCAPRYRAASALGADTPEVLADWLGMQAEEIQRYRAAWQV